MAENTTQDELLTEWNTELKNHLIVNNVILGFYMLFGLIGNTMVIVIYKFRMKVKRDDRFFIPALATIDLVACIMAGSFTYLWNMLPVKFPNELACQMLWFSSQSASITSVLVLLIIAIHRYIKVCRPMVNFPQKWKYGSIGLSIIIGCISSIPIFFFYGTEKIPHYSKNLTGDWCGQYHYAEGVIYYDVSIATTGAIAVFVLLFLYILIGRQIYRKFNMFKKSIKSGRYVPSRSRTNSVDMDNINVNTEQRKNAQKSSRTNSLDDLVECETYRRKVKRGSEDILDHKKFFTIGQHFRTHRYSYMFMTITSLFVISYTPRVFLMCKETLEPHFWERPSDEISRFMILYRMYILNHALNPFIYTFFDTRFRSELSKIFCGCRKDTTVVDTRL